MTSRLVDGALARALYFWITLFKYKHMYDINREKDESYEDCYVYKSKNEHGQVIVCEGYRTTDGYINFSFYITTKRKSGFQYGKVTGKDGVKSLLWAKKCLLDFISFSKRKFKGFILIVHPDDNRRRKVYEHYLIPLGFNVTKDKHRSLYMRL
jgi:hypothetical protein